MTCMRVMTASLLAEFQASRTVKIINIAPFFHSNTPYYEKGAFSAKYHTLPSGLRSGIALKSLRGSKTDFSEKGLTLRVDK